MAAEVRTDRAPVSGCFVAFVEKIALAKAPIHCTRRLDGFDTCRLAQSMWYRAGRPSSTLLDADLSDAAPVWTWWRTDENGLGRSLRR